MDPDVFPMGGDFPGKYAGRSLWFFPQPCTFSAVAKENECSRNQVNRFLLRGSSWKAQSWKQQTWSLDEGAMGEGEKQTAGPPVPEGWS